MNIHGTLDILKKTRKSLIDKEKQENTEENINNQIKAIDGIVAFTNVVLKHFSPDTLEKIMKDEQANKEVLKELIDKYESAAGNDNIGENKKYETIFTKDIILRLNHKLTISIVLYGGRKYIILEPKKYLKHVLRWVNWPNLKFPSEIIYDGKNRINDENKQ